MHVSVDPGSWFVYAKAPSFLLIMARGERKGVRRERERDREEGIRKQKLSCLCLVTFSYTCDLGREKRYEIEVGV